MKQKDTWNIPIDGTMYMIKVGRKEISVTPGQTYKIKQLNKHTSYSGNEIEIPVGNTMAQLHINMLGKRSMVVGGIDCDTGLEYEKMKMPGWGWGFVVFHVINFFLVIGGAIGGAIDGILIALTITVASNSLEKVQQRVLKCAGIYILGTIAELILAAIVYELFIG